MEQARNREERFYVARALEEFARRKQKNASYSLRAYARQLGISVTALSECFSGKRELSPKNRQRLIDGLGVSPKEQSRILGRPANQVDLQVSVQEDEFRLMSHWYYMALLSLARQRVRWSEVLLGQRLGISVLEIRGALETLRRLGLIDSQLGHLVRTGKPLSVHVNKPSATMRRFHGELIEKAKAAIDSGLYQERDMGASTFLMKPSQIAKATQLMTEFRQKFREILEAPEAETADAEVYALCTQIFPLSQTPNKKKER